MRDCLVTALLLAAVGLVTLTGGVATGDQADIIIRDQPAELYREGQPPVLEAPPETAPVVAVQVEVPSGLVRDVFRRAYRDSGSPRLAVFWNRVFSDGLRDMVANEQIVIEATSAKATGDADKAFSERETDRVAIRAETRRDDGARRSPVTEIGEFRFQAGYLQPLIEEGAKVIDRAAVMRLTDAAHRQSDAAVPLDDRQLVETAALKDHADLLIQIALSPSIESETGVFFSVSIVEIQTGQIRATFFHDGTFSPPTKAPPNQVWKAVRGGYILVTEDQEEEETKIDLEQMGRILAEETMIALARQ